MRLPAAHLFFVCLGTSSLLACDLPSGGDQVYAVRAEIVTGEEGSDGDVELCWTYADETECHDLSSDLNDFEEGYRQRFDVRPVRRWSVDEMPSAIWLTYTPGLSLGDQWSLASLDVTAYGQDDSRHVLCRVENVPDVPSVVSCLGDQKAR